MSTVHIVPTKDSMVHDEDTDECVCGPKIEPVFRNDGSNGWMIVHHRLSIDSDTKWRATLKNEQG